MTEKRLPVPKGILFDLGGTLLRLDRLDAGAGFKRLLELCSNVDSIDKVAFRAAGKQLATHVRTWRFEIIEHGVTSVELRFQSYLRLLTERFGMDMTLDLPALELEYWRASCRMCKEPGVEPMFDHLARRGIPSGLVSNTLFSESSLHWELSQHQLSRHLTFVMASADYGVRKPHTELFLTAARRLGLKPADVWFVGNCLETDIAGAREAGMVPVWYTREYRKPGRYDGLSVANWTEFVSGLLQA